MFLDPHAQLGLIPLEGLRIATGDRENVDRYGPHGSAVDRSELKEEACVSNS